MDLFGMLSISDTFPVHYLLTYRLQWGKPDTRSKIKSRLDPPPDSGNDSSQYSSPHMNASPFIPKVPLGKPKYFTADISPELLAIIQNDWPYSGL